MRRVSHAPGVVGHRSRKCTAQPVQPSFFCSSMKGKGMSMCELSAVKLHCSFAAGCIMDTSQWPPMAKQAMQRLRYIIGFLETGSKAHALKVAGFHSPNAHHRVLEHLKQHGTLDEAPHVRPSVKFSNEVLAEAQDHLLSSNHALTTAELVAWLQQQGQLDEHTDCHNFLQHFKQYLGDQELTLKVADTASIFRITEKTAEERLKFCERYEPLLESSLLLQNMVVCDETTFEESPHPKGSLPPPIALLAGSCIPPLLAHHWLQQRPPPAHAALLQNSPMAQAAAGSLHLGRAKHPLLRLPTAALPALAAAGQKVPPHLRIVELMDPVEKTAVPARSRRELNVLVFLRKGHEPVVFTLTGSSYDGMPALQKWQHTAAGGKVVEYVRMSALEYIDCIDKALPQLTADPNKPGLHTRQRDLWLLQDKAKPHTARATLQHLQRMKPCPLQVLTLPTDSPDLTPCDSSFFAAVKAAWRRACAQGQFTWEQRVQLAFDAIKKTNPDPFIDEMPLRWKACKAASGWHIEQELHELKS